MKQLRSALILGLGFFALAAQTLLFRDFLAAFEGSELGVGSFFGSWLLWVGLGAVTGRIASQRLPDLTRRFELTVLLYLPAFLLQHYLITHARSLGGVPAYEVYPFGRMFAVGLIANAPISLVTGLLFTLACRWWEQGQTLPPARVYIVETFGSFFGGVTVTLLLAAGVAGETVICISAAILVAGAAICWAVASRSERSPAIGSVLGLLLVALLTAGLCGPAHWWSQWNDRQAWSRLLPSEHFQGSFTTAQSKYLYGRGEGQFLVMSWGGVSETLPNTEHASEVIALGISQQPTARRVLVIGSDSLGICLRLRKLPQIREVVWLHPDPQYASVLLPILPDEFRAAAGQVAIPSEEVRTYLQSHPRRFDLILLNLPDPTTLVLNRYWTQEFFERVKQTLADNGVLCTRVTGAANFMGGERIYVGASALVTLESVFDHVVLKPGDESWLMASTDVALTTAPAELRDRFARVEGAAEVYPPDGLMSLYPPDRIAFQQGKYREAAANVREDMLINRDAQPKAMLFSLLLALRQTTLLSFARHVPILWAGGIWMAACPIGVYGLLRLIYLLTRRRGLETRLALAAAAAFDGRVLIFATGLAGMALSIVLMLLYQSRFGSLFLHVGLISSLFMLGSFVGSLLSERLLTSTRGTRRTADHEVRSAAKDDPRNSSCEDGSPEFDADSDRQTVEPRVLLPGLLLVNLALIALLIVLPDDAARSVYALLFVGCGFFVGVYFPLGAHRLCAAGRSAAAAGASLEMLDNLGGAAGALLCGWLLLPLLGTWATLGVIGLLVGVNLVPVLVGTRSSPAPARADWFDRLAQPCGYTLLGVAASVLGISHIAAGTQAEQAGQRVFEAARMMTRSSDLVSQTATRADGSTLTYWVVPDTADSEGGFVFSTESLADNVSGYGGPVVMAVYVSREGTLRDLQIVQSRETPAYVESLRRWLNQLPGHNVFQPHGLHDVDAVSGATMTSMAVLRSLGQAGPRFAADALGMNVPAFSSDVTHRLDPQFICLFVLLAAAVFLRRIPRVWVRRSMLLATLLVTGVLWNLQYSSQQVMAILSLSMPGNWLSGSFFLILIVPVIVILVGNVYCGYVCPFGALQELVGDLRPRQMETDPKKSVWRYGRAVKYGLLALLVVLFALTRRYDILATDPLLTVFSSFRDGWTAWVAFGLVIVSFFFRRFWCRALCPAGAFLALLGGARLLRRLMPRTAPGRCDMGVRTPGELDCLFCDRCKHAKN